MMLLDTHVILWLRLGLHLGQRARTAIDKAWEAGELAVSAISFWEIALLESRGRINFPDDVGLWRREQLAQGIIEIPLSGEVGIRAANLADFHRDPADRIIVAPAMQGHQLVTEDRRILAWPGPLNSLRATA
jgi:PIN domain nuclease of toxin-antitoxin system